MCKVLKPIFIITVTVLLFFIVPLRIFAQAQQIILPDKVKNQLQQTVILPIIDGVNQTIPPNIGNQSIAAMGFVDVTAKPFMADNTGKKDSTKAIQHAVNFARDNQMVCFFPSGKYQISDTISCIQKLYQRSNGKISSGRNFPCFLLGSRLGKRPEIILSPHASGFQNTAQKKYMIHFWPHSKKKKKTGPQHNISFNQMFVNINLTIGANNSGAVAIRHKAAQGSAIQESRIEVNDGFAGIEGACGSGGSFADITIIGGKIGMDLTEAQPSPTITGITLINQKEAAIVYGGRQTLTAVGVKIITSKQGPVIIGETKKWAPFNGQISLIDSQIIFNNAGKAAISTESSLFMKNVYIKNTKNLIENPDGYKMPGSDNGWVHIKEYAYGIKPKKWKGYQFETPIYINGSKLNNSLIVKELGKKPPENLQTRHLWKRNFPDWQSVKAANVKLTPYNAKGDGKTDDTKAIQKAINEKEIIFLPKGYYIISKTLTLKENSKIIGAGRHLSVLMVPYDNKLACDKPFPLIKTVNQKNAETIISFCGLYIPRENTNAYMLNWQCGGASILRAVNFFTKPYKRQKNLTKQIDHPLVLITKNGGGKWYNFFQEDRSQYHGLAYRHLMLKDGAGPISFYQCNPEHANSQANMEINNYRYVSIYGLKGESPAPILMINNSDHISSYGYGGNAYGSGRNKAIFQIKNTPNFLIANAVDTPSKKKHPDVWSMIIDEPCFPEIVRTLPLERPVLFKRGIPKPGNKNI